MFLATTLFQTIRTNALNTQNRNARRQAMHNALESVTSTQSDRQWVGFDEHFMDNGAAELMASYVNGGQLPTVETLTNAWIAQFPYADATAQKAIANITPMVTEFVTLLASEQVSTLSTENPDGQQQPMSIAESFV